MDDRPRRPRMTPTTPTPPSPLPLLAAATIAAAALFVIGACATEPAPSRAPLPPASGPRAGQADGRGPRNGDADALLPERMRIHPLTRVTRDPEGEPQLALHLELKDRYGHNIKALGYLRVELSGAGQDAAAAGDPTGGADDDARPRSVYWEIDLRDPERNALMYDDLISRTYLIHLGGLPPWVIAWAEGAAGAPTDPWLNLHATFIPYDPASTSNVDRTLRADHRLER